MSAHSKDHYFVPDASAYPFLASIALFCIAMGGASFLNGYAFASTLFNLGMLAMGVLLFIWFRKVIIESPDYNMDVDKSFRMGMSWFIFSEVMFFAAFFGALYYIRALAVPWLAETELLWPGFEATWPLLAQSVQNCSPACTLMPRRLLKEHNLRLLIRGTCLCITR